MATNLSAEQATQIQQLREQQASLEKMITSIAGGPKAKAALLDPLAHTMAVLGFQSFEKPETSHGWNLQMLCGLEDCMWNIYKEELKSIVARNGMDTRFSITKQPIQQCVTDTVNEMIKTRKEIVEKISDPDWFIRQTLQGILKSLRETHHNRVTGKERVQKPKTTNKDEDGGKGKAKDEDEDKDKDMVMTNVGDIPHQRASQASSTNGTSNKHTGTNQTKRGPLFSNTTILDSTPQPPFHCPKPRFPAEELHTVRDWSSPVLTPFNSGRHNWETHIGNEEGPTPMPIKMQKIVNANQPAKNILASSRKNDSDEAEAYEQTPKPPSFMVQAKKAQVSTEASNNHDQTLAHKEPRAKAPAEHSTASNTAPEINNSQPDSDDRHTITAAVTTNRTANTNQAGSKKRKASEDDTIPEAPASKKGKGETTPARVFLAKNFETPMPASPMRPRLTRSKASQPPAASSSALPPPPEAPKSKADSRKASTLKAAATRRANKLAREAAAQARAENKSK